MDSSSVAVRGFSREGESMDWVYLKRLGKGSYGVVYLVKVIPKNHAAAALADVFFAVKTSHYKDSSSLQKELKILQRFRGCPNIVHCFCEMFSFEQDVYNLFLEYAPGGCLLNLIVDKYGGKIPERHARCYARMLVEGVRAIHEKGYVHCDLKPDNILVYPPSSDKYGGAINTLKVADFGLVRLQGEIIDVPMVEPWKPRFPGTAVYMPPEGIDAEEIKASLDIWSLGCVVLVMVTGNLPWQFKDTIDLASQLSTLGNSPKVPEDLSIYGKDFLSRCFARNPKERWTAEMLLRHPFLLPDHSHRCLPSPSPSPRIYLQHV